MRIWRFGAGRESLRQPMPVGKLVAFAVVGLLCLGYLLFNVVGTKTFEGQYDVAVDLTATGGLFPGSQVTYRGVPVGSVSSIDIAGSKTGVIAHLEIHNGVRVPTRTLAVVADRSPAGEQYLDLRPTGGGPPYLADGSVIPRSQTQLPPSLAGLLDSVSAFSHSINLHELRVVFDQLDTALGGSGPALGRIIDNSAAIIATLQAVEPQTIDLLDNTGKLLDTQVAHGADLHKFSVSLRRLADTLRADRPKAVRLIHVSVDVTHVLNPLLRQDAGDLSALLANLVVVGRIVDARLPGLRAFLTAFPQGIGALASAVHGGHVSFELLASDGAACKYKTRREAPYDGRRLPPILNAYCLHPSSSYQQRGAINAPRPPGDDTAGPPGSPSGQSRHSRSHSTSWTDVFAKGES